MGNTHFLHATTRAMLGIRRLYDSKGYDVFVRAMPGGDGWHVVVHGLRKREASL